MPSKTNKKELVILCIGVIVFYMMAILPFYYSIDHYNDTYNGLQQRKLSPMLVRPTNSFNNSKRDYRLSLSARSVIIDDKQQQQEEEKGKNHISPAIIDKIHEDDSIEADDIKGEIYDEGIDGNHIEGEGEQEEAVDDDTLPYSYDCDGEEEESEEEKEETQNKSNSIKNEDKQEKEEIHSLSGLDCTNHGGPNDPDVSAEMVYWEDIPSDALYRSPFLEEEDNNNKDDNNIRNPGKTNVNDNNKKKKKKKQTTKYITYQPSSAGFNNERMAFETIAVLAITTGRTLVLPNDQVIEHLMRQTTKSGLGYNDFFHLDFLNAEHDGFDIISMEEFLQREGLTGNLKRIDGSDEVLYPPRNRTDWNGRPDIEDCLYEYLSEVGYVPRWNPTKCVAAIPSSNNPQNIDVLKKMINNIFNKTLGRPLPRAEDYIDNPTPVNGPPIERLREMLGGRTKLCIYNEQMQQAPLIFYSRRILAPFYTFLFFQDWRQDVWAKRFVRDHLRYNDNLMCAAARVVAKLHEKARQWGDQSDENIDNPNGIFDSMHIRRGDFEEWYDSGDLTAQELYDYSAEELTAGSTIYIATDERNKTFFEPIKKHYNVYFLDDFVTEIQDVDKHFYGVLDQLIASKGRLFFGTFHSTMSSYIHRIRGYSNTKHKLEGYKDGTIPSYYFFPLESKMSMRRYYPVSKPLWVREFPVVWRDIDRGITAKR